jgi:hypothetical protein
MPDDEKFFTSVRGIGRSEMLPDGDSPFLELPPQPVTSAAPPADDLGRLALHEALERFRWDFDPDEAFNSGRVSVEEFFGAFP